MVSQGWATHFKKYSKDQQLSDAELWAREHQLGMWKDVKPPAPLPQLADTNNVSQLEVGTPVRW